MDLSGAPPRIRRLSAALANRIAAGEVVERPASIVKELVENSLDAGADRIVVHISRGGMDWIRVTDNGRGIHPEDLPLALERHATSKISSASDLDAIVTLGFRGEALPSIASVAELRLVSRAAGQEQARELTFAAGGAAATAPAAHPPGTTVEVRGLFRQVPARRRFLRSERTEYLHILELVKRLALSRPRVGVRLMHNQRLVLNCPVQEPGAVARRLERVLGAGFMGHARAFDVARGTLRLHGWLGDPREARNQSDQQFCYLNGRLIRDRHVNHALRFAYGEDLPPGRYPAFVVYLELDPGLADVNVHPTKHEVRFRHARDVHDFLAAAVREGLNSAPAARAAEAATDPQIHTLHESGGCYRAKLHPASGPDTSGAGLGRLVADLNRRFIITERGGAYVLINMHALRLAALQLRLDQELAAGPLRCRPLLVPVDLSMDEAAAGTLDRHSRMLGRFGFELARTAPGAIGVRAVPVLFEAADLPAMARELAAVLAQKSGPGGADDRLASLLLAHGAAAPSGLSSAAELDVCLGTLTAGGVDVSARNRSGLWRTLEAEDLHGLIGGHD